MKKLLIGIILATNLFATNVNADVKQISISQIQTLQGVVYESNSAEYTCIDTIDGNGWAIYYDSDLQIGSRVIVVFDDMGTDYIYDDEIIQVVKIID